MQPTEDVVKDQLQGILHWVTLSFGYMEQYQNEFRTKDRIRVPVVDVSKHRIFGPLSEWLKKTTKRNRK